MPDEEPVVINPFHFEENNRRLAELLGRRNELILENQLQPRIRRRSMSGQVLDTVGIELESLALSRENVARLLSRLPEGFGSYFQVHRDGSSEIKAFVLNNNLLVNAHTRTAESLFSNRNPTVTLGYELISAPIDIETAETLLHLTLPVLKNNGDFFSERCATHIHVGAMKNLGFLKRALKLGLWFDEVFFALAHMDGEKFRGYSNNAIYARPIVNGPYFRFDRSFYQILNYEKALEAEDMYSFFSCFGVNSEGEMPKYHPARYFSINLYSVPRIGTLEFRHFNQTHNPYMVTAVTKLCQMFVEIAIKARANDLTYFKVANVFETKSPSYYMSKIYQLMDLSKSIDPDYSLNRMDIKVLQEIIERYKGIGITENEVMTHCRDFEVPREALDLGGLKKSKSKPIPAGNTDIHNIQYSSILGG